MAADAVAPRWLRQALRAPMSAETMGQVVRALRRHVRAFRATAVAAVAAEERDPFRVLVACLLSLRTQDTTTGPAAARLFRGFGGMLACELYGGQPAATAFARGLRVAVHSASLGGPETLVTIPATTSHAGLSASERAQLGISDGLVRISVGLEHVDDLRADFAQALDAAP